MLAVARQSHDAYTHMGAGKAVAKIDVTIEKAKIEEAKARELVSLPAVGSCGRSCLLLPLLTPLTAHIPNESHVQYEKAVDASVRATPQYERDMRTQFELVQARQKVRDLRLGQCRVHAWPQGDTP